MTVTFRKEARSVQPPPPVSAAPAEAARPSGPPGAPYPVVHRLRLCPASEDPDVLVPVGPVGLAPGLVERISRLAESGNRCAGPVLTYGRLPDGGSVLCRLTPDGVGLDVRVSVLPEGAARAGVAPIEAWPEESWTPRGALAPYAWIDRAELVRFAGRVRGRLSSVLADVRDLFAEPAGPQVLLVERTPDDVARWVALICASLPRFAAGELTFTTSAGRPYAAYAQIIGISPDADFRFSEAELRYLYRVRSHEGRCSPASNDAWAEIAARLWQHGRPELINSDVRIPLTEPFDAGRLAAVALLEHLPIGREAELLAADWLASASTGRLAQRDVDGLMAALTRIDRSALGPVESRPAPAVMSRMLPAFRALRRRATPEATAPVALRLGRAAMRAALDRHTAMTADPLAGLGLGRAGRRRLLGEFGSEVRALLGDAGGTPSTLARGLVLAAALGLELTGPLAPSAEGMAAALAAACAAHDRRTVVALLGQIDGRGLTSGVLARLEATALTGRAFEAAELARFAEGGAWLTRRDVRRHPALRVILAATDPRGPRRLGFELFRDVWQSQLDLSDAALLPVLGAVCWPLRQELLTVREAIALGELLPAPLLRAGGFDGQLRAVFERCVREFSARSMRETVELAAVIRQKHVELGARSGAAADFLVAVKSGPLTNLLGELEGSANGQRVPPALRGVVLSELSDRLARGTPDLLVREPVHAAVCFYIWTELATSDAVDVRRAAARRIDELIIPALLRADTDWPATVGGVLAGCRYAAQRWDELTTRHERVEC